MFLAWVFDTSPVSLPGWALVALGAALVTAVGVILGVLVADRRKARGRAAERR
ncbi:hypothetical protein [Streptacidiphilus jiangxiensis]|uniref:hypothetical protein n=1 Tax=Streptacidiphilus jiangxiensis TaxID=235985 RepID=UPI000A8FDBBF|nr:hypothetical protein [Streptacidiphilus jiangxiensis]